MKKLIIKKRDRTYILDFWNIKVDIDKRERIYSLISGMDEHGMYFQMKLDKVLKPVERETEVFLKL